jgi:hypothetical protein
MLKQNHLLEVYLITTAARPASLFDAAFVQELIFNAEGNIHEHTSRIAPIWHT